MTETAAGSLMGLVPAPSNRLHHGGQPLHGENSLGDRAVWNLWVACKVCSYLSAADLLNYLCAVAPGGLAEQQVGAREAPG